MTTQKSKTVKRITQGALVVLILCIAIPFGFGMYAGITSHMGTTGAIAKALEKECNCKDIEIDLTAYGLQYSKEDGVTGEKAAYVLKDCAGTATALEETKRFNKIFLEEIEGYAAIDIIHFQFKNGKIVEGVTVKKGVVQ